MNESHCLQLRRVGPEHLLNGTVALDRMQKRFVAAQANTTFATPADRGAATTWSSQPPWESLS